MMPETEKSLINKLPIELIQYIAFFRPPEAWPDLRRISRKFTEALDLIFDDRENHVSVNFIIACQILNNKGWLRLPLPPSTHCERFELKEFKYPTLDPGTSIRRADVFFFGLSTNVEDQLSNLHEIHLKYNALIEKLKPSWSEYMRMLCARVKLSCSSFGLKCEGPVFFLPKPIKYSLFLLFFLAVYFSPAYIIYKKVKESAYFGLYMVFGLAMMTALLCYLYERYSREVDSRVDAPSERNECCRVSCIEEPINLRRYKATSRASIERFESLPKGVLGFFQSLPPLHVDNNPPCTTLIPVGESFTC